MSVYIFQTCVKSFNKRGYLFNKIVFRIIFRIKNKNFQVSFYEVT